MRILVTGARSTVGRAVIGHLLDRGLDVVGCDLESGEPGDTTEDLLAEYLDGGAARGGVPFGQAPARSRQLRADLANPAGAHQVVRGMDAVIHTGGGVDPGRDLPYQVMRRTVMGTFNLIDACTRWGVRRLVTLGAPLGAGPAHGGSPRYCPLDEHHPVEPREPHGLGLSFGEQLCRAAGDTAHLATVCVRPAWVQWEGSYGRTLGPYVRDPELACPSLWAYLDVYDLAELLGAAVLADTAGHHVVCAAAADTVGGHDLAELLRRHHPGTRLPADHPAGAGPVALDAARDLLGWVPRRSWRDYLDESGRSRFPSTAAGPTWPGPVTPGAPAATPLLLGRG